MIKNIVCKNLLDSKSTKKNINQDLKISQNNENLSPNNSPFNSPYTYGISSGIYSPTQSNNFPSSTKNSFGGFKKVSNFNNVVTSHGSFNPHSLHGPQSTKNSENVLEKKIMRASTINNLSKKKIELKSQNTNEKEISLGKTANLNRVKISHKKFGVIEAYSAMTTEGIYRDYNEDRVSIIFNVSKPTNFNETSENPWPKCSFFGLYDGHGGSGCADFLRDNLHKFITNDHNFPKNPQKAIFNGFLKAEKIFTQNSLKEENDKITIIDRSGSCAHVVLILEKRCYIANVGDSRTIMSGHFGDKMYSLSRDHRPNDEKEYERILEAGGKIYQTEANVVHCQTNIMGPLRVSPGKLSVSRTIGDIEAKDERFRGNPNVIIPIPEIKYFEINSTNDFLIIGCDGIFEKLKNKDIIENYWRTIKSNDNKNVKDIHNLNGILIESLIDECIKRKSTDNLTAVMISFKNNFLNKENYLVTDYVSQSTQPNKIPKIIKTENVHSNSKLTTGITQNQIISKIIKSTQSKMTHQDKFMSLNK